MPVHPWRKVVIGTMQNLLLNPNQQQLGLQILLDSYFDFFWFKAQGTLTHFLHDQNVKATFSTSMDPGSL